MGGPYGQLPADMITSAATINLCAVLSARDAARGFLVLAAVPTASSSCVLALNAPDSTSTPRTLVDTALAPFENCRSMNASGLARR
jgi:hypothetical protein